MTTRVISHRETAHSSSCIFCLAQCHWVYRISQTLCLSTCIQFHCHVYFSHYLLIRFFKNISQLVTLKSDSMYLLLPCFFVILCCCIQSLKCMPLMKVLEAKSYFNSCDKCKNRFVMNFLEHICREVVNICIPISYYISCSSTFSKH